MPPVTTPLESLDSRSAATRVAEEQAQARELALRHGLLFVELGDLHLEADLFHSIPFDLMLRYGFVPIERAKGRLVIAMKDPTDVVRIDELELQLGTALEIRVAAPQLIDEILQKSESTQRVLDQATEEFRIQLVQEDERGEEVLSLDRITAALPTSISRRARTRCWSSTASTACSTRRWSRSTSATTRPSSRASR
jgi:hypothetical protein